MSRLDGEPTITRFSLQLQKGMARRFYITKIFTKNAAFLNIIVIIKQFFNQTFSSQVNV